VAVVSAETGVGTIWKGRSTEKKAFFLEEGSLLALIQWSQSTSHTLLHLW
jgi:hypothetical protein